MTLSGNEIRKKFVDYFVSKGHTHKPSASLVPSDPTVLLTIAGMLPFKPIFMGIEKPDVPRAVSVQKCIRTNDIENVGRTARHQTFFEMLGNFSFGDYFKKEAIGFAWEFLTHELKIPKDRLYISVFENDDEAITLWQEVAKVPEDRIFRMGADSNFWSAGPTGPCGPCSEIYYDFGPEKSCGRETCTVGCDCDRYLEVWNLVFMQYNRDEEGNLHPLPKKSIDTGSGLERVASVLQNTPSNFETDLIFPIIQAASKLAGVEYGKSKKTDVSLRIIADHARATVHLISDGVFPSNVDRGYVLRRILRRAVRHGRLLGVKEPFLHSLVDTVIAMFKLTYPALSEKRVQIIEVIKKEEERFLETLETGLSLLQEIMATSKAGGIISGGDAFKLYDTYGFPLELTVEIAQENHLAVEMTGFEEEMEKQRDRARVAQEKTGVHGKEDWSHYPATLFAGYDSFATESRIIAIFKEGQTISHARTGERVEVLMDKTPFYAESGGQVGDSGYLKTNGAIIRVEDTKKRENHFLHICQIQEGVLSVDDHVIADIDRHRRAFIRKHHTSVHLLQAALRKVLGPHVEQAGSLVEEDRFRFDFNHYKPMTPEEVRAAEDLVNEQVLENIPLQVEEVSMAEAKKRGALAFFGDKYGEKVRLVEVGDFSKELCGGTHVRATGDIGLIKITSESGIAAGVRRIEGVSGLRALELLRMTEATVSEAAELLKSPQMELINAVKKLRETLKTSEKEIRDLKSKVAFSMGDSLLAAAQEIKGVKALTASVEDVDSESLGALANQLKQKLGRGIVLLASASEGKVNFNCAVSDDLVKEGYHAGNIVKAAAQICGGGGGGKPNQAQAGGKDASKIDEALKVIGTFIK